MLVCITPKAHKDLAEIRNYIARDNIDVANKYVGKLYNAIDSLKENYKLDISLQRKYGVDTDYYYYIFDNYLIFYKIKSDSVRVYRVLHGAMQYLKILRI